MAKPRADMVPGSARSKRLCCRIYLIDLIFISLVNNPIRLQIPVNKQEDWDDLLKNIQIACSKRQGNTEYEIDKSINYVNQLVRQTSDSAPAPCRHIVLRGLTEAKHGSRTLMKVDVLLIFMNSFLYNNFQFYGELEQPRVWCTFVG